MALGLPSAGGGQATHPPSHLPLPAPLPRNEVYHSNRAAALTALKRYAEACDSARHATELAPRWAKGWARLGAAAYAQEQYGEAVQAYENAARLEPSNKTLAAALEKARLFEARQEAEGVHKFKRRRADEPAAAAGGGGGKRSLVRDGARVKNAKLLSFGQDDEEGG